MVERVVLKLLRRGIQQQKSVTQCKQHKKKRASFLEVRCRVTAGPLNHRTAKAPNNLSPRDKAAACCLCMGGVAERDRERLFPPKRCGW